MKKRPGASTGPLSFEFRRSRTVGSELVGQAHADGVEVQIPTAEVHAIEHAVVAAEVRIAILDPGGQVVGDGVFHARSKGPARQGVVVVVDQALAEAARDSAEGKTAGGVDQSAVEGEAGACPNRALPVEAVGAERHGSRSEAARDRGVEHAVEVVVVAAEQALDVTFDTDHERAELVVVAGMTACQEAVVAAAKAALERHERARHRTRNEGAAREIVAVPAPGIANLRTDVEAGPGEDRDC